MIPDAAASMRLSTAPSILANLAAFDSDGLISFSQRATCSGVQLSNPVADHRAREAHASGVALLVLAAAASAAA